MADVIRTLCVWQFDKMKIVAVQAERRQIHQHVKVKLFCLFVLMPKNDNSSVQ